MLTLEETGWALNAFKAFSFLNILPIQVDVKTGKIGKQSNRVKLLTWKISFGVGFCHCLYIFWRLVQSTIVEPEKYFRWDHFAIHSACTFGYMAFYFTGFHLFVKAPEENVLIFNHLFIEWEDPVQKMIEQQLQLEIPMHSKIQIENGIQAIGNNARSTQMIPLESAFEAPSRPRSGSCPPPRPLLTWPVQYSVDEILAKLLPFVIIYTDFFVLIILAVDPSRPQLLYSAVPPDYQNVFSFVTLLAIEALGIAYAFLTASYALFTQIMFFGKCQSQLKQMGLQLRNFRENFQNQPSNEHENGEREIWILRQILKEMKQFVVFVQLFNRCYPLCIFYWKLCALSLCTMEYWFAIRNYQEFPVIAGFIGYTGILDNAIYAVMYDNAFSIPEKMEELKQEFLQAMQKATSKSKAASASDLKLTSTSNSNSNIKGNNGKNPLVWAQMKREMKKIQNLGIKVGHFHKLERESTPTFIDFVVNQVVSLLVTFPR